MERKKWLLACGLYSVVVVIVTLAITDVYSQVKYPSKPLDIIVPYSAGGSTDLTARLEAAYLSKKWGVPVNVINKAGGSTLPACLEVYQSRADGYTLLADGNGSSSMLPNAVKDLPFKIMDRTFIAMTALSPEVIIVSSKTSFKSLKEIEAMARQSPEKLTWTAMGGASPIEIVVRQFLKAIDVDVLKTRPVTSPGGSQAVVLVAGGHVMLGVVSVSSALPAIKSGTVRPIAITSKTRFPDLQDLPTTFELGYPTVNAVQWVGISGPPQLPSNIVGLWDKTLQELLRDPDSINKLRNVGAMPFYHNADATREFVAKEEEEVRKLWSLK